MVQPQLKTGRLLLRPYEIEDASAVQELFGAWDILRMLLEVPYPYPEGQALR